jgi:hypothetical protein
MLDLALKLIDYLVALAKKHGEVNRATFDDFVEPTFQTFEKVHADYIESLTRYSERLGDMKYRMDWDHPVFRDIEMDSLKSGHLRKKLADFNASKSPPKLQMFLNAIHFYLRGLSASGERAEFLDKFAVPLERSGLTPADIEKGIGGKGRFGNLPKNDAYLQRAGSREPGSFGVIFADPWREALRTQLLGFDAPSDWTDDEEWREIYDSARRGQSEEERRRLCGYALRDTIRQFQHAYGVVSTEYAMLRSELLSPS